MSVGKKIVETQMAIAALDDLRLLRLFHADPDYDVAAHAFETWAKQRHERDGDEMSRRMFDEQLWADRLRSDPF